MTSGADKRSFLRCPPSGALRPLPHLEVDSQRTVREGVEVHLEDLEGDVVVVQLAVAERDVDVEREVLAVLEEQALVHVCRFLIDREGAEGREEGIIGYFMCLVCIT